MVLKTSILQNLVTYLSIISGIYLVVPPQWHSQIECNPEKNVWGFGEGAQRKESIFTYLTNIILQYIAETEGCYPLKA